MPQTGSELQNRIPYFLLLSSLGLSLARSAGAPGNVPPHGQIVYSAQVSQEEYTHDGGRYDLFLRMVPNGKVTRLTNHRAHPERKLGGAIREPSFSADGKRVLFLADDANSDEDVRKTMTGAAPYPYTLLNVWGLETRTPTVRPYTKGGLGWHHARWSPSGHFFCAVYPSRAGVLDQDVPIPDDIYVWNTHTRKGHRLARVPYGVDDLFWSRNGSSVIYQSGPSANLYSVPRQGGKSTMLLRGKAGRFGYSFSPDSRKVAYVDTDAVYVANASGSSATAVVKLFRSKDAPPWPRPQWARDGKKLAACELSSSGATITTKLHVYDAVIGKGRAVATLKELVTSMAWSNSGHWLVVNVRANSRVGLLAISAADGNSVMLKEPDEVTKGLDWCESH